MEVSRVVKDIDGQIFVAIQIIMLTAQSVIQQLLNML